MVIRGDSSLRPPPLPFGFLMPINCVSPLLSKVQNTIDRSIDRSTIKFARTYTSMNLFTSFQLVRVSYNLSSNSSLRFLFRFLVPNNCISFSLTKAQYGLLVNDRTAINFAWTHTWSNLFTSFQLVKACYNHGRDSSQEPPVCGFWCPVFAAHFRTPKVDAHHY